MVREVGNAKQNFQEFLSNLYSRALTVSSEQICPVTKGWHTED